MGKPKSTLCGWVERGMAHPEIEPWGSFSEDYRRAEAGIAGSIGRTIAMRIQVLEEEMVAYGKWRLRPEGEAPPCPSVAELAWLERVRESRWPNEYGDTKHRAVEAEMSADTWLEDHALQQEQLGALFADPPELIRAALVSRAADVYAILLAGGFDPAKTKG